MREKMGNQLPKVGNELPLSGADPAAMSYEAVVAEAVRRELGGSHQAIKTLMKRTGASARTAKNWLSGAAGPSGAHLMALMRSSDSVFEAVLKMTGRDGLVADERIAEANKLLRRAVALLADRH